MGGLPELAEQMKDCSENSQDSFRRMPWEIEEEPVCLGPKCIGKKNPTEDVLHFLCIFFSLSAALLPTRFKKKKESSWVASLLHSLFFILFLSF